MHREAEADRREGGEAVTVYVNGKPVLPGCVVVFDHTAGKVYVAPLRVTA